MPMAPTSSKPVGTGSARKGCQSKTKEPISTVDQLKRLFTSLCAQIDGGHFSNALKTCDKILRLQPADQDARQTKIFLLLQTEQYSEALDLIGDSSDNIFERAYALYRLQREDDARSLLNEMREQGEDDRRVLHLEAQLSYREGVYQEAFDLYNQLLDTAEYNSEEHSDILTNLQASQKHLDFINAGYRQPLGALPLSITSTLETSPPPAQQVSVVGNLRSITPSELANAKSMPKKVRMRRVPPGVIPGVTPAPDPERWLKKSERTSFNHGKRKKGGGGGATQGAAVDPIPTQTGNPAPLSKAGGKGKKKK